jgi:hypothetical protein
MIQIPNPHGRLIDIPYAKSPPVLFTYRVTAPLALGQYDFGGVTTPVRRTPFLPERPLLPNTLYLFDSMSFAMDIDQNDYQAAIDVMPSFAAYNQADAGALALREAVSLDKYFENYRYRLTLLGSLSTQGGANADGRFNKLYGSVSGIVTQTANLIGKASLTAIIKFTAMEVTDKAFVRAFTEMGRGR